MGLHIGCIKINLESSTSPLIGGDPIRNRELLGIAVGWRLPADESQHKKYVQSLREFATDASEAEFVTFVIELRRRALKGEGDYLFTVYPAVRAFLGRFPGDDGRKVVGLTEAIGAGFDDEAREYYSQIHDRNAFFALLVTLLRPGQSFDDLGGGMAWEIEVLAKLVALEPELEILNRASQTLQSSGHSIKGRQHELLWNQLFALLQKEYDKRFEALVRGERGRRPRAFSGMRRGSGAVSGSDRRAD